MFFSACAAAAISSSRRDVCANANYQQLDAECSAAFYANMQQWNVQRKIAVHDTEYCARRTHRRHIAAQNTRNGGQAADSS